MKHLIFLFAVLVLFCATAALAERTITIGRPTNEVRLEYKRLQPIALYLAKYLRAYGVTGGEVVLDGKNSVSATIDLIKTGKIDLIFETPYSSLRFIEKTGAVPLLLIEREGVREYGSYIFARKDSGISSIEELAGHVIAFEDAGSTSAYHVPRSALERAGLELIPIADPEANVPEGKVGFVFAGSELNVSSWVQFGRAQAGALSNLDWNAQNENPEAFRQNFTILHKTEQVPRMLVLARPGLEPELIRSAVEVLAAMHLNEEGRGALSYYKIDAFYPIDDAAAFIDKLRNSLLHLGQQ